MSHSRPPVTGFEQDWRYRFTAALTALNRIGWNSLKIGTIPDPLMDGTIVCVKIENFRTVFRRDEVAKIVKTEKRTPSLPLESRKFVHAIETAADDAASNDLTIEERRKMI